MKKSKSNKTLEKVSSDEEELLTDQSDDSESDIQIENSQAQTNNGTKFVDNENDDIEIDCSKQEAQVDSIQGDSSDDNSVSEENKNKKRKLNKSADVENGYNCSSGDEQPSTSKKLKKKQSESNTDDSGSESGDDTENGDDPDGVKIPVINPLHYIRNKERRKELYKKLKIEKNKTKRAERKQRRREGGPRHSGHTIESLREQDQTTVSNLNDSENEELQNELEIDEFADYFQGNYTPKIVITFSDNPNTKTRKFGIELSRIFPNALVKVRNRSSVKKMCKSCIREGYTDLIIINENRHKPNGLLIIHLPNGPSFHFKVSNVKLTKDLRKDHKEITKHRPEVILTNFTTRLGLTVGRLFGALFNHDPQFQGRRVCTFHNQRDFIFFRHHRYEFTKTGQKAKLKELGPRFTLKLRSIQEGTFDSITGDYSWIITNKRHAMEGRRKFYL